MTPRGVCFVMCWNWWLRSPNAGNSYNARNVNSDGSENNNNAYNGNQGLRPLRWNTATE